MKRNMATVLSDRTPYIKHPDGSKDEIMFTAKNVNMYEGGNTVQQEIEDLKTEIDLLKETIATLRSENAALQSALEAQMLSLRHTLESTVITKDKIVEALGFEPCERISLTVFQGSKQATDTEPAVTGTSGLVPPPAPDDTNAFLCGNGTWRYINTDQFLTKTEAETMYLPKSGKALSAWQADVAQTAYNIPYTAKGNIWIKERDDA